MKGHLKITKQKKIEDFSEAMRIAANNHSKQKNEKGATEKQISTLVDTRNNNSEENYKLSKKEVSENKTQRRTNVDKQRGILRSKGKIRGDNRKGENQIVERILHSNNRRQPLECGV